MEEVPIDFHWGAEVFVHPEVVSSIEKYGFTLDNTNYVFIEFPSDAVPPGTGNLVYSLMAKGFVPIISHPERNKGFIERPELLYELVQTGLRRPGHGHEPHGRVRPGDKERGRAVHGA